MGSCCSWISKIYKPQSDSPGDGSVVTGNPRVLAFYRLECHSFLLLSRYWTWFWVMLFGSVRGRKQAFPCWCCMEGGTDRLIFFPDCYKMDQTGFQSQHQGLQSRWRSFSRHPLINVCSDSRSRIFLLTMANADWAEAAVLQEQYLVQDFGDMKVNASNRAKDGGTDPLKNNITNDDEEKEPTAAERSLLQKLFNKGLVENKNDVEVQRRKPESPLHSVKSFEDLPLRRDLLKGPSLIGNSPVLSLRSRSQTVCAGLNVLLTRLFRRDQECPGFYSTWFLATCEKEWERHWRCHVQWDCAIIRFFFF